MSFSVLDLIPASWPARLIGIALLLLAGFLFYSWSYHRGWDARQDDYEAAAAEQKAKVDQANREALAAEIDDAAARAADEARTNDAIEVPHASDDDPAPDAFQSVFDSVRAVQARDAAAGR